MILGTPDFGIEQVGGDFGDPWVYGGVWLNEPTDTLYAIRGLESEGIKDTEPDDIEVPPEVIRQIVTDLGGDPDRSWKDDDEQQEHYIERDVENAIFDWQYERAKEKDAQVRMTVYIASARLPAYLERDFLERERDFDRATWEEIQRGEDYGKVIIVAETWGWDHVGSDSMNVTKAELAEMLKLTPDLRHKAGL